MVIWFHPLIMEPRVVRRYPDLKNSILLCVLFLVFQIIVSALMMRAGSGKGLMIIISVTIPPVMILGIAARTNRTTLARTVALKSVQGRTVVPLIAMTVSLAFIISEVENLTIQYLIPSDVYQNYLKQFLDIFFLKSKTDLVLGVLSIALVGPFMEEAVFRGVIFRGVAAHQGPTYGVIASSVLFMAVHINPLQFPGALILGLIYSTMISRGYRTSDTFLAHGLHNSISLLFLFNVLSISGMNPAHGGGVAHVSLAIIAACLVVFAVCLSLIFRYAPGPRPEDRDVDTYGPAQGDHE